MKSEKFNNFTKNKEIFFKLEDLLNKIFTIIIKDKTKENEINSLELLKIVQDSNEFLLELGLRMEVSHKQEDYLTKFLQDKLKNMENSEKNLNKILDLEKLLFKSEIQTYEKFTNKSKKYSEFYESFSIISKEMNFDVSQLLEKYQTSGTFYNINNSFMTKNSKLFINNSESLKEFESLITFFKNDIFFMNNANNILQCMLFHNSYLLKDLNLFVEIKLFKLIDKIREDVYSPVKDMLVLYEQKKEMDINSYYIQMSNFFEFNQQKIKKALENLFKLDDECQENCSFKLLLDIYKIIKNKYLFPNI